MTVEERSSNLKLMTTERRGPLVLDSFLSLAPALNDGHGLRMGWVMTWL
jgi:hypothetical protein